MMQDNDSILSVLKLLIPSSIKNTYNITKEDIDNIKENQIGLYLRSAGSPIYQGNRIVKYDVDFSIRIHGKKNGQVQLSKDVNILETEVAVVNYKSNEVRILSLQLRGKAQNMGVNSSNIPVYQISYLVTLG